MRGLFAVLVVGFILLSGCLEKRKPPETTTTTEPTTSTAASTMTTSTTQRMPPTGGALENHPFGFAGPSQPPDDFDKISSLGVTYVRESMAWGSVVDMSGFDYSKSDAAYDALRSRYGLKPIVRLKLRGPATKCDTSLKCPKAPIYDKCPASSADCPPKDLGAWSEKGYSPSLYEGVYKTMEHLFGTGRPVEYIIVGNEVNTLLFWHASSEAYLRIRGTVYKAVHDFNSRNNGDVKVVDNGFAGGVWGYALIRDNACSGDAGRIAYAEEFATGYFRRRFTQTQLKDYIRDTFNLEHFCANPDRSQLILRDSFKVDPNVGGPSFDVMAYHFYEPWDTQEEIINWIKAEMKKNGYERPIMNTEGGYFDGMRLLNDSRVAAEVRRSVADEIPKLHVVAFANGVKTWLWLPFTERYGSAFYGPQYSGLVSPQPELEELPAFTSYKVMVEKLDGFTDVQRLNTGEYSYRFTVKDKPVYVLWSGSPKTVDLGSELAGRVRVTAVDGASSEAQSSSLQVTESPIYVEG